MPEQQTFGEYMRGGKPLGQGRGPDVITGERTWRTRDQVVEGTTPDGGTFKKTTDQLGNDTIQETTKDGKFRQHVRINVR